MVVKGHISEVYSDVSWSIVYLVSDRRMYRTGLILGKLFRGKRLILFTKALACMQLYKMHRKTQILALWHSLSEGALLFGKLPSLSVG